MRIKPEALRILMAKEQLSVDALIAKARCSSATIQKAKQGKDMLPKTVGKIAAALGVEPEDILQEA